MSILKHKNTPPAEVNITIPLIKRLLDNQFPELAHLPISFFDAGWDNEMYRLGDELVIRMPRRKVAVELLENERFWLPNLSSILPIDIPTPKHLGSSNADYPWIWNINPWFNGQTANEGKLKEGQSIVIAQFLKTLHVHPSSEILKNDARATLIEKKASIDVRIAQLKKQTNLITSNIETIWEKAMTADRGYKSKFIHGDLHPKNILVNDGKFEAILDWGDMTHGDVSIDLSCLWTLFEDPKERQMAIDHYQPSQDQILKAKGWAVFMGVLMLHTGLVDNSTHASIGTQILMKMDKCSLATN